MKVIRDRICDAVHKCLQWKDGEIGGIDMLKLEQHIDGILAQLQQHIVMQAEGSDVSEGAAVASEGEEEANTCAGGNHLYETNTLGSYCSKCGKRIEWNRG